MTAQMPSTSQERSRMANTGVEVGAKIFGVCTNASLPGGGAAPLIASTSPISATTI